MNRNGREFIKRLMGELKRDEGLRLIPYRDSVGKLTIGYGRNLDDKGITEAEADILLRNDIRDAQIDLDRSFPGAKKLTDNRYRALINMVFNLGIHRFMGFRKMLGAILEDDFDRAADEMLNSLWHKQVKGRAERLAEMMREG